MGPSLGCGPRSIHGVLENTDAEVGCSALSFYFLFFFSCLFWVQAKWPKPLSFDEFSPVAQCVVTYSKQTSGKVRLLAAIWHHLMKETFRGEISCIVLVQEFSLDIIYHLSKHSLDKTHAKHTQNTFFQCVFSYFILILFFFRRSAQLVKEDDDSAIPYCASIGDVDTVLASQIVLCWCFRSYFYWLPAHFHRVVFVTSYLTISCGSPWYTKSTCNHWLLFAESNVLGI